MTKNGERIFSLNNMKVAMLSRIKANWVGGDFIQLEETKKALERLGVEVEIIEFDMDFFPKMVEALKTCDVVHLFNFSMYWTKIQLWAARKAKKPIVCSMIYHESGDFVPFELQQIMLNETSMAIFQTEGERERVKRHLNLDESKSCIIPNGIDKWWLEKCESRIGMEDFVLTVGRIEPNKGQLACAKACKKLKIPYVCIGENRDKDYHKKLIRTGAIWYDKMTREELKPWYYSAKVVVQPSAAETWCLVIDEAISQGTQVVLTDMCERDDIEITRCKHDDVSDIMSSIKEVWLPKDYTSAKLLKTWDDIALDLKKVYEKVA